MWNRLAAVGFAAPNLQSQVDAALADARRRRDGGLRVGEGTGLVVADNGCALPVVAAPPRFVPAAVTHPDPECVLCGVAGMVVQGDGTAFPLLAATPDAAEARGPAPAEVTLGIVVEEAEWWPDPAAWERGPHHERFGMTTVVPVGLFGPVASPALLAGGVVRAPVLREGDTLRRWWDFQLDSTWLRLPAAMAVADVDAVTGGRGLTEGSVLVAKAWAVVGTLRWVEGEADPGDVPLPDMHYLEAVTDRARGGPDVAPQVAVFTNAPKAW